MPRVMFYVQHLLGTGHVKRALIITERLRALGCEVLLVSGGARTNETTRDANLLQLPPVRARDESFHELIDEQGKPIDGVWQRNRGRLLFEAYDQMQPDVLIIESYPFGRRKLRFELEPLLQVASGRSPRPWIACSVRDVVQSRSPERVRETIGILGRYFDMVMTHGDPALVEFGESFPLANEIHTLRYTGYVADSIPTDHANNTGQGEILVSAGGGAVGLRLFDIALKVQRLGATHHRWRILVGHSVPEDAFDRLRAAAGAGVLVERNRADYCTLLRNCAVSVSQAGYNTVIDILRCGARAVLVPFEGQGETEQITRATKLERAGRTVLLTERTLAADTLAKALDRCLALDAPGPATLDLDGANTTAQLVVDEWRRYRASL